MVLITGKTLYLWLEYFEVLSGDIDLVMHLMQEHLKLVIFSKTLPRTVSAPPPPPPFLLGEQHLVPNFEKKGGRGREKSEYLGGLEEFAWWAYYVSFQKKLKIKYDSESSI